jgi:putative hydrolase of the HAD superfamily
VPAFTTIFFDLDDTLYPSSNGLWDAIGERIHAYMVERVGVAPAEADRLRGEYLQRYGTTLNGLIAEHQIDALDYLDYVHDVPLDEHLRPDAALREMLARLPQRRVIFTNSSRDHVRRVLSRLGVADEIDDIVDILRLELVNKPRPEAYERAMSAVGESQPGRCVIVDDLVTNLGPARALGMTTVLVGTPAESEAVDRRIARASDLIRALPELVARPDGG